MGELSKSPSDLPLAVLLDFDGVIVDSLRLHLEAWRAATLAIFGQQLADDEDLIGRGTRAIAGLIASRLGDRSVASSLVRAKESWLKTHIVRVELLPGAREMVAALRAKQIPYGIASNSPGAFVRGALEATGLDVPHVIAGDQVPRGKPHPDIYWQLANRLDIDPSHRGRVYVFEDSPHGIAAAIKAGMIPLGVASELPESRLLAAGAAAVCEDLGDALAKGWLDGVLPATWLA